MNSPPRPALFFGLVLLLSLPFYLLGFLAPSLKGLLPAQLPISALMFVVPLLVAVMLTWQQTGKEGIRRLLSRTFDWRRSKPRWLLVAFGTMPLVMLLSYAGQRALGQQFPDVPFPWLAALFYFALYFIGAIGEELGWMGYAIDPLQSRYGPWGASLLLGGSGTLFLTW